MGVGRQDPVKGIENKLLAFEAFLLRCVCAFLILPSSAVVALFWISISISISICVFMPLCVYICIVGALRSPSS